jgi:hypothetical protein
LGRLSSGSRRRRWPSARRSWWRLRDRLAGGGGGPVIGACGGVSISPCGSDPPRRQGRRPCPEQSGESASVGYPRRALSPRPPLVQDRVRLRADGGVEVKLKAAGRRWDDARRVRAPRAPREASHADAPVRDPPAPLPRRAGAETRG